VILCCRNQETALGRFGVQDGSRGIIYTRTGRHFFAPPEAGTEIAILERLGNVLDHSGFWEEFATGWVCLDTELMPWSAKARSLLLEQYAPVGRAGRDGLAASIAALKQASQIPAIGSIGERPAASPVKQPAALPPDTPSVPSEKPRNGPPSDMNIAAIREGFEQRQKCLDRYTEAYRRYCWAVFSVEDYRIAPFHILATEGKVWNGENHLYHIETIKRCMTGADPLFVATNHITVDLGSEGSVAQATDWWLGLTGSGGEGMVVKPLDFIACHGAELLQPAVKCRGREYLRIIYGPEYTESEKLQRLRRRSLTKKRRLALAEFALGQESLERFVRQEPLHRLHECVFAVLALENEVVDPRL
jgi:protein phosphatase